MALDANRIAQELGNRDVQILALEGDVAQQAQVIVAQREGLEECGQHRERTRTLGELTEEAFQAMPASLPQVHRDVEHLMFPKEDWERFTTTLHALQVHLGVRAEQGDGEHPA